MTSRSRLVAAGVPLVLVALGLTAPSMAVTESVPVGMDRTCSTDVTEALTAWLASVPDGGPGARSVALFRPGCYRIDGSVRLAHRAHLELRGENAELRAGGDTPPHTTRAQLWIEQGTDIRVTGFTIRGTNPEGGPYDPNNEHDHNVFVAGGRDVGLWRLRLLQAHGDAVSILPAGNWDGDGVGAIIPERIQLRRSGIDSTGRHGVACTGCDTVTVADSTFDRIGYHVFDAEVEAATWPMRKITLARNTIGTVRFGLYSGNGAGVSHDWITIARNVMTGTPTTCFGAVTLASFTARPAHVRITSNVLHSISAAVFLNRTSDALISGNTTTGWDLCNGPGGGVVLAGGDLIRVRNNRFTEAHRAVEVLDEQPTRLTVLGNLLSPVTQ